MFPSGMSFLCTFKCSVENGYSRGEGIRICLELLCSKLSITGKLADHHVEIQEGFVELKITK